MNDIDAFEANLRGTLRRAATHVPPDVATSLTTRLSTPAPPRRPRTRPLVAGVVAAVAVVVAAALLPALLGSEPDPTRGQDPSTRSQTAGVALDLSGQTLQGDAVSVADYGGRPLVVFVWGSWCKPCRNIAGRLSDWSEATGIPVLGVDTSDTRTKGSAFEEYHRIRYPSVFDPDGRILNSLVDRRPGVVPLTLVLDAEGVVSERVLGAFEVERTLSRALANMR
jgi:thiol-disulfide isomerase/thioredoxin